MSDTSPFGFGRFVPGFDFLQNLAKGSAAGMPSMSSWVAPTVSVEELDKRIEELKAVQFWLEQNARALAATIQALEVQKMTLATLKGMNVAMGDLAGAFAGRAAEAAAGAQHGAQSRGDAPGDDDGDGDAPPEEAGAGEAPAAAPGVVDAMQWWTALGTQFQQIAATALQDATANQAALDATRGMAEQALKTATGMASQFAAQGGQGMQGAARRAAGAAPASAAAAQPPQQPRRTAAADAAAGTTARRRSSSSSAPGASPAPARARKAAAAPAARKAPARRSSRPAGG